MYYNILISYKIKFYVQALALFRPCPQLGIYAGLGTASANSVNFSFSLITSIPMQAEPNHQVQLHLDQTRFPCKDQYIRVRDGDALSAELLLDVAFDKNAPVSGTIVSSETNLLVEFFSDEGVAEHASCVGGFLAHATMLGELRTPC